MSKHLGGTLNRDSFLAIFPHDISSSLHTYSGVESLRLYTFLECPFLWYVFFLFDRLRGFYWCQFGRLWLDFLVANLCLMPILIHACIVFVIMFKLILHIELFWVLGYDCCWIIYCVAWYLCLLKFQLFGNYYANQIRKCLCCFLAFWHFTLDFS